MSNLISRRTLTLTSQSLTTEAWIKGFVLGLEEQISAEVTTSSQDNIWTVIIESDGDDDMEVIIDAVCDLRQDLGTATTDVKLVDSYGCTILGEDYVAD